MTLSHAQRASPLLSVLFVTYKRVQLLERNLQSVKKYLDYEPAEYVVADDGSPRAIQDRIRKLGFDRLALAAKNRGLGANNNQGLRSCRGKYILLLQDDWEATDAFVGVIGKAVDILEADDQVGMIRLYLGRPHSCPMEERGLGDVSYFVYDHRSPIYESGNHVYSDTPHIRRQSLNNPDILGFYREDCSLEASEQDYADRVDRQDRFRVAILSVDEVEYFRHLGESDSFRTRKLRYRLDAVVRGAALVLGLRPDDAVWARARPVWFGLKDLLIRLKFLK